MAALERVRIRKVGKRYGGERALAGVSLELARGAMTAVLGHNGAGKTTLLGILSTLVRPSGGEVAAQSDVITGLIAAFLSALWPGLDPKDAERRANWLIRVMVSLLMFPGADERDERARRHCGRVVDLAHDAAVARDQADQVGHPQPLRSGPGRRRAWSGFGFVFGFVSTELLKDPVSKSAFTVSTTWLTSKIGRAHV